MSRPRKGVALELLPLALILMGLAGTLGLVVAMHRRAETLRMLAKADERRGPVAAPVPEPEPDPQPAPQVVAAPPPPAPVEPPPPAEDPTQPILARLSAQAEAERASAREADRKAKAYDVARRAAEADSERLKRKEALVQSQVANLTKRAETLENQAALLAAERDVLARQRDMSKDDLAKALAKGGGYAVLPNKGAHGTWQRPVIIECRDGMAFLQPKNLAFSMMDMSPVLGMRGSPLVGAVARELVRAQSATSPDGEPVVPYIYFIIRPNGIRPYYEARGRLEQLGIAFGYELVDQDWPIEFPDFDALATWDGLAPLRPKPAEGTLASSSSAQATKPKEFVWPVDRGSNIAGSLDGKPATGDGGTSGHSGRESFIWPTTKPGGGLSGGLDEGPLASGSRMTPPGVGGGGGGVDLGPMEPPLPGREIGRPPTGLGGLGAGSRGAPGQRPDVRPRPEPAPIDLGLVAVDPRRLPGFDPTGQRQGEGVSAGPVATSPAGSAFAPENLPPLAGLTQRPPQGRVRIDPRLLAYVDEAEELLERLRPSAGDAAGNSPGAGRDSGPSGDARSAESTGSAGARGVAGPRPPLTGSGGNAGMAGDSRPSPASPAPPPFGGPSGGLGSPASRLTVVPLHLTVACGPNGVTIHPGGYWLSTATLRKPGVLAKDLSLIVANRQLTDPTIRPIPRVEFLVEPGGGETFAEARRQTVLNGLDWPVTIRSADSTLTDLFPKERF